MHLLSLVLRYASIGLINRTVRVAVTPPAKTFNKLFQYRCDQRFHNPKNWGLRL